jgi:hypothetical protein
MPPHPLHLALQMTAHCHPTAVGAAECEVLRMTLIAVAACRRILLRTPRATHISPNISTSNNSMGTIRRLPLDPLVLLVVVHR